MTPRVRGNKAHFTRLTIISTTTMPVRAPGPLCRHQRRHAVSSMARMQKTTVQRWSSVVRRCANAAPTPAQQ